MNANHASIHLEDFELIDTFFFPGSPDAVPATVSYDISWTVEGPVRQLKPGGAAPTDPTYLRGKFRDAAATGTFAGESVTGPGGGPFSFEGGVATSVWAELGHERNGVYID